MKLLFQDEPWQADGICRQADPELWFSKQPADIREAKQICGQCEVWKECREYSLRTREPYGTWGGVSEKERRKLLGRHQAQPPQACGSLWHLANDPSECPNCAPQQAA